MDRVRAERRLDQFANSKDMVFNLIGRSFLSDQAKTDYSNRFIDRLKAIAD